MSVISSRTSLVSIVRTSLNRRSSVAPLKFHIYPHKVETALYDLYNKKDSKAYEELLCILRDCRLSDEELSLVLTESALCVGFLDKDARLLVEVLCNVDWPSRNQKIVDIFSQWFLDLLTAQISHASMAIGSLVKHLTKSETYWEKDPSEEQTSYFTNVHNLIAQVVAIIPLSGEVLLKCAVENYPYYKHSASVQQAYVHNLLNIIRYLPSLTEHMIALILNRLIVLDVNIKSSQESFQHQEDLFSMEQDIYDNSDNLVDSLDVCMDELFKWLQHEQNKALDTLYSVFERTILPTHGTRFVQFLFFYGLSIDSSWTRKTLEAMWQLVVSANVGPVLRQASVAHLSGILARANFIPHVYTLSYIKIMADWCHSYINTQDSMKLNSGNNPHAVFYSICQSLLYLVAFKHNKMFLEKKGLVFVQSLNLSKIVMSSLNPLRMCPSSVAETFASVTRMHQVVYCHTIMEHNTRNYLRIYSDAMDEKNWFPYDPYTLRRSFHWIKPFYGEYEDILTEKPRFADFTEKLGDDDDFLATSPINEHAHSLSKNSFKGFRHL